MAINMGPAYPHYYAIRFHTEMYTMAEKFDLKNLKKLAETKFLAALQSIEPIVDRGSPVDPTLIRVLQVVPIIYSTTLENDRGLRDPVVEYVARHWYTFLVMQQFKTFMAANTEFIIEVIEAKEHVCSRCQKHAAWEKESSSMGSYRSNDRW